MNKICFFGGSFDPIHKGHLKIAEATYKQMGFDKVVFCPVVCSPHKDDTMFSFRERLDMIDATIKEFGFEDWAEVSPIEMYNNSNYTFDFIIGHTGPIHEGVMFNSNCDRFLKDDPDLVTDLTREQEELTDMMCMLEPKLWFMGHYHKNLEYTLQPLENNDYSCHCVMVDVNCVYDFSQHFSEKILDKEEE